jgi:Leucine Rich repeat
LRGRHLHLSRIRDKEEPRTYLHFRNSDSLTGLRICLRSVATAEKEEHRGNGKMDEEPQQQQQQQQQQALIHGSVLAGIARLDDPRYRDERHKLRVNGYCNGKHIDRRSLQHLVDFLDNRRDSQFAAITELTLDLIILGSDPSPDGGWSVLRDFFGRRDAATLTKVTLDGCDFGTTENASQLFAAFHTNRTVTDINIYYGVANLSGAALGNCVYGLLQNMPQLQSLNLYCTRLRLATIHAFQPALRANRTLKELHLGSCDLGADGIRLLADTLVGNNTLELLNVRNNNITSACLVDITRMIESTQLKNIDFFFHRNNIFYDEAAIQDFVSALQQKNSSVQEMPMSTEATRASINNSLARNRQLNHVALLLVPQPPLPPSLQYHRNAGTIMLQISHYAIAKFAGTVVPNNAGASAIFKLFQARPALLEKRRIQRPTAA